jgi:hypothetical protein
MKYSLPPTATEKGRVIMRTFIQTWGAKLTKSKSVLYWSLRCNTSFHFSRGGLGEHVDIKEVTGEWKIRNNRLYMLYASQNLVRAVNLHDDTGWGRSTRGRNEKVGGYLLEIVGRPVIYLQCRRSGCRVEVLQVQLQKARENVTQNYLLRVKEQNFTFMWPCIVTNFFVMKATRCTNFTNLFCLKTAFKLSSNLYDIYHCWVYSE